MPIHHIEVIVCHDVHECFNCCWCGEKKMTNIIATNRNWCRVFFCWIVVCIIGAEFLDRCKCWIVMHSTAFESLFAFLQKVLHSAFPSRTRQNVNASISNVPSTATMSVTVGAQSTADV